MFRSISFSGAWPRIGRSVGTLALVACLGLGGCTQFGLGPNDYDTTAVPELFGPPPPSSPQDFFGVSNKAREIEKNFSR